MQRMRFAAMLFLFFAASSAPTARADVTLQPLITSGLASPIDIASGNDASGRLFIVEQIGRIRIIQNGTLLPTPFLNIQSIVSTGGERGLLGLAFHPQYASNGQFFVYYTTNAVGSLATGDIVVARYLRSSANANLADAGSAQVVITIPHSTFANHNGGSLKFGPDGYLYIGVGDGGSGGDPFNAGQNLDTLLAKILRIDISSASPYVIPPTNPFTNGLGPGNVVARPEIWAYGVRNPWRMSFDRQTGDHYIGDVGQDQWEEIDRQAAGTPGGVNYGWRILEATHCYNPSVNCVPPANYVPPILEYPHTVGNSVTGGFVYRGSSTPDLAGKYMFGDFSQAKLFYSPGVSGASYSQLTGLSHSVSAFGEGETGELYLANYSTGAIYSFSSSTDVTPDAFAFFRANAVGLNTPVVSNTVRVTGLGTAAGVSIVGGEYSIGCTGNFVSAAGTIANNTNVCVRHTSANTGSTLTTSTLTVGTFSAAFISTTVAAFIVTPSAEANGSISPNTPQLIAQGSAATFSVTPNAGFVAAVSGSCGGTLVGALFTTNAITADCTVSATFSPAPPTLPGPPTITGTIAGNAQASIRFNAPASDGGTPIISYTATCDQGSLPVARAYSPITLTGLTNGTTYQCRITAANSVGSGPASNPVDVIPILNPVLTLVDVISRKSHGAAGTFELPIDTSQPIGGLVTVEPRMPRAGHTLVFRFNDTINTIGNVTAVDASSLATGLATALPAGSNVVVTLSGIADNTRVTIALANLNSSGLATSASLGFLVGDINNSRAVNAADVSGVKAQLGPLLNSGNFTADLDNSGNIDVRDIAAAKSRSGQALR